MTDTHLTAPTRFIEVDGDRFAYRRWGRPSGVPLFFVPHFRAGLDHWDPLLTDGMAEGREVILFNGRGIASSSGTPRNRIEDLADDIAAAIQALGLAQVDLLGFSIGGLQVQEVALRHSVLVRKLLLLGTGLRGGDPTMDPKVLDVAPTPVPTAEDFLFLFFGRSGVLGFALEVRRHELVLTAEVLVERRLRRAGLRQHAVDADGPHTLLVEQAIGGVQEAITDAEFRGFHPFLGFLRHPLTV